MRPITDDRDGASPENILVSYSDFMTYYSKNYVSIIHQRLAVLCFSTRQICKKHLQVGSGQCLFRFVKGILYHGSLALSSMIIPVG